VKELLSKPLLSPNNSYDRREIRDKTICLKHHLEYDLKIIEFSKEFLIILKLS